MFVESFQARCKGESEQVRDGKDDFGKAVRIGWMYIAFDGFIVKQTVNNISRFTLGTTDDSWVKK